MERLLDASACSKVRKKAGLTRGTSDRMNWKTSANSKIMQHISPNKEVNRDYDSPQVHENSVSAKPNFAPASFGIASDFMQKDYLVPKRPPTRYFETTSPLRLCAKAFPISQFSREASGSCQLDDRVDSTMAKDMEDFLLQMLGQGFNIDRDTIGKVLSSCGFDMPKTLENIIDLSDAALETKSNSHEKSSEKIFHRHEVPQGKMDSEESNHFVREVGGCELARQKMEKVAIQKEIMSSLFKLPEKDDGNECIDPYSGRKYKPTHEVVVYEPSQKTVDAEDKIVETKPVQNATVVAEEEEHEYQLIRNAVTEYRNTMREYYKAAIEAYSKGDRDRANKLSEKGQFFYRKAREADEESTRKVYEIRKVDAQDEDTFPLDLSEIDAREAVRIFKLHLESLGGSLAFKYMKVTIEGPNGASSGGARRRRIMKLMDKESVKWVDGGEPGTILVPLV